MQHSSLHYVFACKNVHAGHLKVSLHTHRVVGEQPRVSVQNEPSILPALHEFTSLVQRAIEEARCGGRGGGHRWGAEVLYMFSITHLRYS